MLRRLSVQFLALVLVAGLSLFALGCTRTEPAAKPNPQPETLTAYVGANLKNPVTDLANAYEAKTGVKVEMVFNNSGALLSQLATAKSGDICMPGGMPFIEMAKQKGHLEEVLGPIAYHTPVMITPKGNPQNIQSVEDLAKPGVKLVIPDKAATAIGKTAYKIFGKLGITADVEKNILVSMESPAKVLAAITMGQGNVGIVEYSNTVEAKDKIDIVEIDSKINEIEEIPIALLTYSEKKETAKNFMQFVIENGPAAFAKYGFKVEK